jgi:hypothetical protein
VNSCPFDRGRTGDFSSGVHTQNFKLLTTVGLIAVEMQTAAIIEVLWILNYSNENQDSPESA